MNLIIFGSCVSRDILNCSHQEQLELLAYYARSSLGSAFSDVPMKDADASTLASAFQRRMVEADLQKKVQSYFSTADFDILLLDLVDERFSLYVAPDGRLCTISNELIATGFDPKVRPGRVVRSGANEFFSIWEKGWESLVSMLSERGMLHRLLINKVFWSHACVDGVDFAPSYNASSIDKANAFLSRMYKRMQQDVRKKQFMCFGPDLLVGAADHRWGRSPFHYIDNYYLDAMSQIRSYHNIVAEESTRSPAESNFLWHHHDEERQIESGRLFSIYGSCKEPHAKPLLDPSLVAVNGSLEMQATFMDAIFNGAENVYQLRYKLDEPFLANGVSVRLRLCDWESIRYVAIGYTNNNSFRHVKITNLARERWVDFSIGHQDIAYGLQNDWQHPSVTELSDIRIYIKGTPSDGGSRLSVERLACWREVQERPLWLEQWDPIKPVSTLLQDAIYGYLKKCFRNASVQAKSFMENGNCPLYGEVELEWPLGSPTPSDLGEVGTYRFSWHSLHPAMILMLHARESGETSPIYAAREMVTNWLERSYFIPDKDKKFAWYDHGTAERMLAMVMMWAVGIEQGFDRRFMARLRGAIFRHGQLLASELFYASHQPTRYHNHAWFQDLALLATALAMSDFPCCGQWLETALSRLTDQLDTLIVRDNGYAVFIENSIGYHQGVQRLVEFAGDLATLSDRGSHIPDIARELSHFSNFLRYPDNRAPAQGDTPPVSG